MCPAAPSFTSPCLPIQTNSLQVQKRKRNPAVVARLLRSRKPLANPPFTVVGSDEVAMKEHSSDCAVP